MQTNRQGGSRRGARKIASTVAVLVMLVVLTGCRTSVWGWGYNGTAQVGDGTTTDRYTPTEVDQDVEHAKWKMVSAGSDHVVGVLADGELWAWGKNSSGQVGNGTLTNSPTPKSISGSLGWTLAAAGGDHSLAIRTDGTLWAWGDNALGQLGDGTTTNRPTPTQVGAGITWKTVATGAGHTVAISTDGKLYAWGKNNTGQLGDGTTTNRLLPTQIGTATTWKTLAVGGQHTLAIRTDGTLWGWGDNSSGQVGDNTFTNRTTPTRIGTLGTWTAIAAGYGHSVALQTDGTLWTWGYNPAFQLGNGSTDSNPTPSQTAIAGLGWTSIAAGDGHTVATRSDGTVWAWGDNTFGQIGNGTNITQTIPLQLTAQVGVARKWSSVSAGTFHTVAIQTDGTLFGWGANYAGQLGDATGTAHSTPFPIARTNDWAVVSVGTGHTVAVAKDGTLWAWGSNFHGQLGDGTTTPQARPEQIGTGTNWRYASAGGSHTIASRTDGSLWAWGSNSSGQVGNNSSVDQLVPTQIFSECVNNPYGPCDMVSLSAGESSSSVIEKATLGGLQVGVVLTWGDNLYGRLGLGTSDPTPVRVPTAVNNALTQRFTSVSMGSTHAVAIDAAGHLWAWGSGGSGALGTGGTGNQVAPVQIGTDTWKAVDAGTYHTLAIKADGSLWAWGANLYGELGDGTHTAHLTPNQVPLNFGYTVTAVSAGYLDSAFIGSDGALYAFGHNQAGQLGTGGTNDLVYPTQVGTETKWTAVSLGNSTMQALHAD